MDAIVIHKTPEQYKSLRDEYSPLRIKKKINYIFLRESPPSNGGYFYDISDITYQFLFKAMMWCIRFEYRRINEEVKESGLRKFQKCGCLLADAIYEPINNVHNHNARNQMLLNNLPNLLQDLRDLGIDNKVNIITIKLNVCLLIRPQLIYRGYKVINRTVIVPFPSHGHQNTFKEAINLIKRNNNIRSFCE